MRFLARSFFALVVVVLSRSAGATPIAYEGFQPSFPTFANSGSGFDGPWFQGATTPPYLQQEKSLCYAKLQLGRGGHVAGTASPVLNATLRDLRNNLGIDNTTVYLSFLVQPQGTLNEGLFNGFFGITMNGSLNNVFVGKSAVPAQWVLETQGGSGQVASDVRVRLGETVLIVVKAQFLAGPDVFTLFVNPVPGVAEPSSSLVKSDLDIGTVSAIALFTTGAFAVDEIRMGTTWEDVVPTGKIDNAAQCVQ